MIEKYIVLDPYTPYDEPTVQLVSGYSKGKVRPWKENVKLAGYSEAIEFAKSIQPKEGWIITLVIGLGAWETYGPNKKGDAFPEHPYEDKITEEQVVTKHYKTYEEFGRVYRHHVNYGPEFAIGDIIKAFWNPEMHRIEVVEEFEIAKAPDLADMINEGKYPAKSMGCRVKYDVCSICGNRARARAEYCDHLRNHMNEIDPVIGKQVCALNPSPQFFDSSWVTIPADPTGYMLRKVASDEGFDGIVSRSAALQKTASFFRKISSMTKYHPGIVLPLKELNKGIKLIPPEKMEELGARKIPPSALIKAVADRGGILSLIELIPYVFKLFNLRPSLKQILHILSNRDSLVDAALRKLDLFSFLKPRDSEVLEVERILGSCLDDRFPSTGRIIEISITVQKEAGADLDSVGDSYSDPLQMVNIQGFDIPYYLAYYAKNRSAVATSVNALLNALLLVGGLPPALVLMKLREEEQKLGRPLTDAELIELINRLKEEQMMQLIKQTKKL